MKDWDVYTKTIAKKGISKKRKGIRSRIDCEREENYRR